MKSYLLYTDSDSFHIQHRMDESVAAIARKHGINTRVREIACYGATREYRADKTGVTFTITVVVE